ncbi:hypothetical protein Tco_1235592 [Tanacetum coccineum]
MVSTVKLLVLKKGEYTLWSMRMEQYLTNTDYSLWQVILNGDGPIQVTTDENGVETEVPPKTAQALLQRQRERKAKSILLLVIPDEYQLRFHRIKNAKTLWAAIKSRFGGNVESKKTQKNVLKQQFENFSVSNTEGLDKAYDRNKVSIDDLDINDLYNNLKVFEADIKGSSGSSSNSQNVAFLSAEDTSSSNEVNPANGASTASGYNSQGQASSSSYIDDLMFSFFANQSSGPQLDDEDLKQIDHDDLEEMDLKWQVLIKLRLNALTVIEETILQGNVEQQEIKGTRIEMKGIEADGLGYDWSYITQDEPTEFALIAYTSNSSRFDTERMAKKSILQNMGKNTGQREISLVWNNVQRINHQNKFVPSAVLTRSGKVQVSTAKKSSLRATTSTSTFRPVNTATHTNIVKVSKLRINAFHIVNGVNTAGQTTVSTVKGNEVTAIKASTGCVWRPKMTDLNDVSKDNKVFLQRLLKMTILVLLVRRESNIKPPVLDNLKKRIVSTQQNVVFPFKSSNLFKLHELEMKIETADESAGTSLQCPYDDEDLDTYNSPDADQVMGLRPDFNNRESFKLLSIRAPQSKVTRLFILKSQNNQEPTKIGQSLDDERWVEAMQEELLQFKIQKVWTLVDLPYATRKAIVQMVSIEIRKINRYSSSETIQTVVRTSPVSLNQQALTKDEDGEDVDIHLYRSMIGSLMYLTSSRPDIMFSVCACSRFQVQPKVSHLNAVKRIFRYLKGRPKLGLWYPKDSPFILEAFLDSDYAGASLDRKSTTGGCQFLGSRLISWQCKKQTVVANSTTKAEYIAASHCCGQVLWIQNQMLDYGYNFMQTNIVMLIIDACCQESFYHSKTNQIEIAINS